MVQNRSFIFAEIPTGLPEEGKHLKVETSEFDLEQEPPEGGLTAKVHDVSLDPYLRGRLRSSEIESYSPAVPLGQPIANFGIITVIKSASPKFKPGDVVYAQATYIQEYTVLPKALVANCRHLENPYNLDLRYFVGPLGMPGLTAYSSFYEIGKPKKGEVIFISAASGAVGQIVGQLAKHEGLTVIGSVGDDEKAAFIVNELGFDGAFNYKKEKPLDALKRLAPDGIDIYYENVGGETLSAAITHLRNYGRVVASGMISQYNVASPDDAYAVKNLSLVVSKRLTIRGFIVMDPDFGQKYFLEHQKNVQKWLHDGSFKARLHVTKGIENAPKALLELFSGKNFGKAVLEISQR